MKFAQIFQPKAVHVYADRLVLVFNHDTIYEAEILDKLQSLFPMVCTASYDGYENAIEIYPSDPAKEDAKAEMQDKQVNAVAQMQLDGKLCIWVMQDGANFCVYNSSRRTRLKAPLEKPIAPSAIISAPFPVGDYDFKGAKSARDWFVAKHAKYEIIWE